MRARLAFAVAALCLLASLAPARAGVFIGVGVPGPYYYRPYHHPHYYYGPRVYVAPPPVYVAPRPVYVAPAPVVVQPAPLVVQPAAVVPPPPPPPGY